MEVLLGIVDSVETNELHRVVKNNRLEAVKIIVESRADITNVIQDGQTALHIATELNYHSIMEALIERESRERVRKFVNIRTFENGNAALHIAAKNNSIESVRFLLHHGAYFLIKDKENRRPVDLTNVGNIKRLLNSIRENFDFTFTGETDQLIDKFQSCPTKDLTAMMYARNSHGYTTLQWAIDKNQLDTLASIVNYRIDNLINYKCRVDRLDRYIMYSRTVRRHLSALEMLHQRNDKLPVDVIQRVSVIGNYKKIIMDLLNNAFGLLAIYKEQECLGLTDQPLLIIIDEVLEYFGFYQGAAPVDDKNLKEKLTTNELTFIIKLLKISVVAPMMLFMKSVYLLHLFEAIKKCDYDLAKKCLSGNPDLNEVDAKGWTVMHYALQSGYQEIIDLLLDFGADPRGSSEKQKLTPLQAALVLLYQRDFQKLDDDQVDAIKLHLNEISKDKLASYIDTKNSDYGSTALHMAVELKQQWLVELLLRKGATYCIKDAYGKTPEDYADPNVKALFRYIDELFTSALPENHDELIWESLKISRANTLLAVCGARNNQGLTLVEILERDHLDTADKVQDMVLKMEYRERFFGVATYKSTAYTTQARKKGLIRISVLQENCT